MNRAETVEILLVEDNHQDAELIIYALIKHNVSNIVVRFRDGDEALEFLFGEGEYESRKLNRLSKVALIVLKMPKIITFKLWSELRQREETKTLPVVVLTSSKEGSDIAKCYSLGANSFIEKPAEFTTFTEIIRNIGKYWVKLNEKIKYKSIQFRLI